jgi:hypothetical protein
MIQLIKEADIKMAIAIMSMLGVGLWTVTKGIVKW